MVERGRRSAPGAVPPALLRRARDQAGVVSRRQALDAGLSARQVEWQLRSGRWVRLHRGIYVTHTGPPAPQARIWAALLLCGPQAVAGGRTALVLWGVLDAAPGPVTVCVPHDQTPARATGMVFARRTSLATARHPTVQPPRLRVEEAVLDVADAATRVADVVDVVVRAVQRRTTTAPRLREALARRSRHRWRRLLDLAAEPCLVAEDVAASLRARGWGGHATPCGPACPLTRPADANADTGNDPPHRTVVDRPRSTPRRRGPLSRTGAAAGPPRRSSRTGSGTP